MELQILFVNVELAFASLKREKAIKAVKNVQTHLKLMRLIERVYIM